MKAKELIQKEIRKLRQKAKDKRYEADRFDKMANELEESQKETQ